uniref:Uncharacterized protein n=1 Tax=Anguilla anguilla TaxID=7936 RepID=A0A0E9WXC2_ANGAN
MSFYSQCELLKHMKWENGFQMFAHLKCPQIIISHTVKTKFTSKITLAITTNNMSMDINVASF